MENKQAAYLRLLIKTLREQIIPMLTDPRNSEITKVLDGLLARMYVETAIAPTVRARAFAARRDAISYYQETHEPAAILQSTLDIVCKGNRNEVEAALGALQRQLRSSDARSLGVQLQAIDAQEREALESAYIDLIAARASADSSPDAPDATAEAIEGFLRSRFPELPNLRVTEVKQVPGGFSKQTLFAHLQGAGPLRDCVVIRKDGPFLPAGKSVIHEYSILQRLHAFGVAVPEPHAVEPTTDLLGAPFIVVSRAYGRNVGDLVDISSPDNELALDFARRLASLHAAPIEGLDLPGANESPISRVRQEIESEYARWQELRQPSMVVEAGVTWLLDHLDHAGDRRCVVHRDLGAHNMLVDGSAITALLDWEVPCIGHPAEDLGYVHYTVCQLGSWEGFLNEYAAAGGQIPSQEELDFYTLWGALRVAMVIARAGAAVVAGHFDDVGLAYLSEHFVSREFSRASRKLAELLMAAHPTPPRTGTLMIAAWLSIALSK